MSMLERPSRDRPRGRRRLFPRWVAVLVVLGTVFVVGIAVGKTLDDGPDPGQVTTAVRTLEPLPQEPPPRTVTVTVTQP
jgi:hypothetical protein